VPGPLGGPATTRFLGFEPAGIGLGLARQARLRPQAWRRRWLDGGHLNPPEATLGKPLAYGLRSRRRTGGLEIGSGFRQKPPMSGHVAAIFRHPVKGFTPESLDHVDLAPGEGFPHDRVWAVENGPSGFDPEAPAWTSKQKFTVLAAIPKVAAAKTRYDEATGVFSA